MAIARWPHYDWLIFWWVIELPRILESLEAKAKTNQRTEGTTRDKDSRDKRLIERIIFFIRFFQ